MGKGSPLRNAEHAIVSRARTRAHTRTHAREHAQSIHAELSTYAEHVRMTYACMTYAEHAR